MDERQNNQTTIQLENSSGVARGRPRIHENEKERRIYHTELAKNRRRLRRYLELQDFLLNSPFPQIKLQFWENIATEEDSD